MQIQTIDSGRLMDALHFVWSVYVKKEAPYIQPEAVYEFQRFLKYNNINAGILKKEITLYGAYENGELIGVSCLNRDGSTRFVYVAEGWENQGIEETLVMYPRRQTTKKRRVLIAAACVAALLILLVPVMIFHEIRMFRQEVSSGTPSDPAGPSDGWSGGDCLPFGGIDGFDDEFDTGNGSDNSSLSGIDLITPSIDEKAGVEYTDEVFTFQPKDKKTTYVNFELHYPKISGLKDAKVQDKINALLEETAKEPYDRIYENPDLTIKERVLAETTPILASYVKYKVTYLNDSYLCVAFEDYSYEGSQDAYYVGLRAVNVSLKDGKTFEVGDIVNLSDDFLGDWLSVMRSEASKDTLLSELNTEEERKALSGEDTKDGIYTPVFFADNEGVEIGFSFHYPKGDKNDAGFGWVTAPFTNQTIKPYEKSEDFWGLIR